MNDTSAFSGGPNPPLELLKYWVGRGKEKDREKLLQQHRDYADMVHNHAKEMHSVQIEGRIKEISAYHKLAEPGTPFQAQTGGASVSLIKKTPKARTPKTSAAPAKTAKPLPVRDPKTGRAMKAPQ